MARFYLPPAAWGEQPALAGDEARHLAQVLRGKAGDSIVVFDGAGRRAKATVRQISRDHVQLELGEATNSPPLSPAITLAQAIPKGKNMDLIVQKAVELGVSAIQPLVTENTIVQPGEGKAEKWRRVALEACKQCGQDHLPFIAEPLPLDRWLAQPPPADLRIFASLAEGAQKLKNILSENPLAESIIFLVGPEGDFTAEETQHAASQRFIPATLGRIVLRVETASLFGISAIRYERQ